MGRRTADGPPSQQVQPPQDQTVRVTIGSGRDDAAGGASGEESARSRTQRLSPVRVGLRGEGIPVVLWRVFVRTEARVSLRRAKNGAGRPAPLSRIRAVFATTVHRGRCYMPAGARVMARRRFPADGGSWSGCVGGPRFRDGLKQPERIDR